MKVLVETPRFTATNIIDINPLKLQLFKRPLAIVARTRQKKRLQDLGLGSLTILGWWELSPHYLHPYTQKAIGEAFCQHDAVFFIDPDRVCPSVRTSYQALINYVNTL